MNAAPPRGPKFPLRLDALRAGATRAAGPGAGSLRTAPVSPHEAPEARPTRSAQARKAGASPHAKPTGLGLDSADVRLQMVRRLRAGGLVNAAVLEALAAVPRHAFVDAALVTQAYEDTSLPIGHGQTISKPSVVARMIELLMEGANAQRAGSLGNVLEIGTGCGYQAAVLARLARSVISVERVKPLHDKARDLLAPLRSARLRLVYGDGMRGHPPNAPYDSIISAAGGDAVPQAWLDQLAVGGRLVAPTLQAGSTRQQLVVVDRTESDFTQRLHEAVKFVPLKSGLME
jgi:protein-L-isoaspartate(D-aspartate) O-methyltransferase